MYKKNDLTPVQNLQRLLDRVDVPDYIPDEQVAKYRAMQRQRKCDEGKRKKREKRKKMERAKRVPNKAAFSKNAR